MFTRCVKKKIEWRAYHVFTKVMQSSFSKNLILPLHHGAITVKNAFLIRQNYNFHFNSYITMPNLLERELLAVDLSGVNIKMQPKHPKSVELVKTASEILMNIGISSEVFDLIDFVLYAFSQMKNDDLYIVLLMYSIWTLLIDDHLERYPLDFSKWHNILDGEECRGDGKVEKCYRIFLKAANKGFTNSKLVDELLRLTKEWLETFEEFERLSSSEISEEKLIEIRFRDVGGYMGHYFIQTDAGLWLTEDLESDENWKKLHYNAILHLIIINDLFSLKKDVKSGRGKSNYVYVKMKNNYISAQEAVQQLTIEAENAEQMARYCGEKLKETYVIVGLDRYVDGVIGSMMGNIYWSATCKRYNDI